ncbi:TRAP transporter substrate-binding protein DctP [Pararhodobacter oceanensis]|uniref:C4-dicarboxylate ABC transporter substrate-binding protein n=1 Tax=Pararhodobacter oceanensis TaxID=2172121 RepID=A0A2T8HZ43_9RHOB|nr:TRAP transporter substrate-binding protein DctP [Pararhodobacter oceanensis]PVH30706.1 hypothetical protein DDE20_04105 [Pararhodobacter oceanensis]
MNAFKSVITGAVLASVAGLAPQGADAREMSLASYFPANASFVTEMLEPFAAWLTEQANGEFSVVVYSGGTLGRDPNQQDRIVSTGIADFGHIVPGRNPGVYPHYGLFELPGMVTSVEQGSNVAWQLHQEGILETGDNLKIVSVWTTGPYIIHNRDRIDDISGLSGVRLRVLGQYQTESVLAVDGVPQAISITEAPESINRGTLDGVLSDWSVYDSFRIAEVTDYSYTMPLGSLAMSLVMNPDSYAELSPEGQALIDSAGDQWKTMWIEFYNSNLERILADGVERGHEVVEATPEDIAAMREATSHLMAEVREAAGDEVIDAFIDRTEAFMASQ